jgi:hypothetical protein
MQTESLIEKIKCLPHDRLTEVEDFVDFVSRRDDASARQAAIAAYAAEHEGSDLDFTVYEIVGSALCVASEDGQRVYDRIAPSLREGRSASLSFRNVTSLTSTFLNAAIGQLYGLLSEKEVRERLRVYDLEPNDLALLERVVDTAKEYFKDPHRFEHALEEVLG